MKTYSQNSPNEYCLNTEICEFLICAWILPLIPMLIICVFFIIKVKLYVVMITVAIMIFWFCGFGFLYRINNKRIRFEANSFEIVCCTETRVYPYSEIAHVEKITFMGYPYRTPVYRIHLKSGDRINLLNRKFYNGIPQLSGCRFRNSSIL